jgi:hypothetical protein
MSQIEMFKESVLEELLRERSNYYISKGIPLDFWITVHPDFVRLESTQKLIAKTSFKKRLVDYKPPIFSSVLASSITEEETYACFVTSNKEFFKWIKLRLGCFENENLIYTPNFYSNGIEGELEFPKDSVLIKNIFSSNKYFLNKKIIVDRETLINSVYQKLF